ncbi:MAG: hypothetical protein JWM52_272 [Candidatus Saccharibacteria bacterium]|nr:hypothetical protein [Candidatus Saccharibacteria bacterium]
MKPRNSTRRPILPIILVIAVLIVIAAGIIGAILLNGSQKNGSQPASITDPLRANVDKKTDYEKGTTAQFGYFEVKINYTTVDFKPTNGAVPTTKGNKFVLLNVTAKNIDTDDHLLSDSNLGLLLKNGSVVTASFTRVDPALANGSVAAGTDTTGNILFEVAPDETDMRLYYNTRIYSDDAQKLEKLEYTLSF